MADRLVEEQRTVLQTQLGLQLAFRPKLDPSKVDAIAISGYPLFEIVRHVEKEAIDLVILGMRRRSPLHDTFLGTTAERIVRHVDVPSLIVSAAAGEPYKRVLVAVDGGPCAREAFRSAHQLAPAAEFQILHTYRETAREPSSDPDRSRRIAEQVANLEIDAVLGPNGHSGIGVYAIVQAGRLVETIRAECHRLGCDLLAVGAHGRPSFATAIWGSHTLDILRNPPCDVLVGPAAQRPD
jgi:nucleotide-binding universal stress UspA family protein